MTKLRWINVFAAVVLVLTLLGAGVVSQAAPSDQDGAPNAGDIQIEKIERALKTALQADDQANLFVIFGEQPDLSPAYNMSWEQRGEFVYQTLKRTAERDQARVQNFLRARNIPHRSFIVGNSLYIRGADLALAERLSVFSEVIELRLERSYPVPEPEPGLDEQQITSVEWGVSKVNADDVWGLGYTGQGIVVANIDTGVRYTHNALVNQYRGNQGGGSYNHTYSWYDPTGTYPSAPGDNNGHGTHTMGTMVGDDGGSNQIGVAPGAEWIACKGCTSTSCYDSDLNACADWIVAPGGSSSMRPQVVNNSWGGCSYDNWYRSKTDAWRAAGIHPVFSAGNTSNCGYSSAFCGSVGTPATYKEVTAVGSTTSSDGISSFSLWGPSQDPTGSNEIKPEVSAPGSNIRSSYNSGDSSYSTMSGTSMAAPHTSGALALVWSACPSLIGDFDATEQLMKDEAVKIAYATGCGNEGPGNIPNNAFGYGRIDVLAAVNACSSGPPPTPTPTSTPPPGQIFFDDFETSQGWTTDPSGTDTATTGMWERANPEETSYSGRVYQQGDTVSGVYDLVTEGSAGSSVGSYDIDGGVTSIRSPDIVLPNESGIELSFYYYLAHYNNATADDYLRVKVVGSTTTTVLEELGSGDYDEAAWASYSTSLDAYAGQTIYLLIEAADGGGGSLVEAGIDDVSITSSGGPPPPTPTSPPGPIFSDDFETSQGWVTDPSGTDTATTGMWERANPEETSYGGRVYQLGTTASGSYDLVTEGTAGSSIGSYDIDGGVTSIRSPDITLPSGSGITLSFYYYLAHYNNASSADYLRVKVVGSTTTTVFEELGAANYDEAVWDSYSTSLDAYAGQTIYLLIEAADAGGASLVEAAIDDVLITQ